jgi:hypothetical protein
MLIQSKGLKTIGHRMKRPQKKINTFWDRTILGEKIYVKIIGGKMIKNQFSTLCELGLKIYWMNE